MSYNPFESLEKRLAIIEERQNQILSFVSKSNPDLAEVNEALVKTSLVLERFGISDNTLRTYRRRGIIPFVMLGKQYFYRISDVESALAKKGRSL